MLMCLHVNVTTPPTMLRLAGPQNPAHVVDVLLNQNISPCDSAELHVPAHLLGYFPCQLPSLLFLDRYYRGVHGSAANARVVFQCQVHFSST